jgi:D-xylose transport system permease protein
MKTANIKSEPKNFLSRFHLNFNFKAYIMVLALLVIWALFFLLTDGTFLSPRNLSNLIRQMSITGILALGMVLIIVSGNIDLSIGAVVGLTGAIAALLQFKLGWDTPVAVIAALIVGIVVGFWQGWWVCYLRVPAFIVTLGGMLVYRGTILGLTGGVTISPLKASFVQIGQAFLPSNLGWVLAGIVTLLYIFFRFRRRLNRQKYNFDIPPFPMELLIIAGVVALIFGSIFVLNSYEGIPFPVLILLGLAVVFYIISNKTRFGRYLYAIGGNNEAARLSGINIRFNSMLAFVLMGILGAIGGVILTARLNGATTSAGNNFEMDAIAACVIGGTSLMGGEGNVVGAIIGALVMASLDNGMVLLNTETYWQFIVKGLILMCAVLADFQMKKRTV